MASPLVLLLTLLWAVAGTHQIARGAPIRYPDFSQCRNITLEYTKGSFGCCPPLPRVIKAWEVPEHLPVRVRRPAHTLANDTEYWDKFNRAYALLRALPKDDPRAWENQAWMHCAYCENALVQRNLTPEASLLIHKTWLFLPWHRWYVYFHERILAKLIGDDTFTLPFWNFDNQTAAEGHFRANMLPPPYVSERWAALGDPMRSVYHMPPQTVDIPFDLVAEEGESPYSREELENRNLQVMHRQVALAAVPEVFFGHKYVEGSPDGPGGGTLEYVPHNAIHDWVGDLTLADHENMGNFYSAARDPLFYGLHTNLDRLWQDWLKLGGRRQNIDDPDWLDAEFLFFDENGDGVVVSVAGGLDSEKQLRYKYEEVENAWVDLHPAALGSPILKAASVARKSSASSPISNILDELFPSAEVDPDWAAGHLAGIPLLRAQSDPGQEPVAIAGDEPFHFRVRRPVKSLLRRAAEALGLQAVGEEVITLQGLTTPMRKTNVFDVFLNLPEADAKTPITVAEFAGTFYEIPHTASRQAAGGETVRQDWRVTDFRLAISEVLRQVGAEGSSEPLVVSIVRRGKDKMEPVFIKGVTVELF